MDGIVAIVLWVFLGIIVITIIASTIRIVPQSRAYVVERIGAYNRTCNVGLHILIPFFDRVANKVSFNHPLYIYPFSCEYSKYLKNKKSEIIKKWAVLP